MRTTDRGPDPDPAFDRESAWAHLLESGIGRRRGQSAWTLVGISRSYDRIVRHAEGLLIHDTSNADVLAALRAIRILRDKLDHDERILIAQARRNKITWQRIAGALEMRNRQSAERRYLQLNHAVSTPDGAPARTQSERVELTRQQRGLRAEQEWALRNGASIRGLARALAGLDDLEQRLNRAVGSRITDAVLLTEKIWTGNPDADAPAAFQTTWPAALRTCLADDTRFRADPDVGSAPDKEWERQRRESRLLHRMFGLIAHAASPDNIDLADQPSLARAIAHLNAQRERAMAKRA